jgi:predicted RNA polymerase sigma factor
LPKILYVFLSKVWLQSQKQMWLKQLLPFIELNGGRIVAILIRLVGDFDVAEEAAQAAFTAAVNQWESDGIPDRPRAWIIRTARYKAIDHLRRRTKLTEKLEWYAASGLIRVC